MEKGYILDQRYEIIKIIGNGGGGEVYLSKNIRLDTLWAIKKINKENRSKTDIMTEANILKNLRHEALPRIFDVIIEDDSIFIVMDYINGDSLKQKVLKEGKINEEKALVITETLLTVLMYLHSQKPKPVIFRDLKPSNIIISDNLNIKLVDFGIAREFKKEQCEDTVYIGTNGYAAPEQYGFGQTGVYSDIYSLGATLVFMLTGKKPDNIEIKKKLPKSISPSFVRFIEKCMMLKPEQRYQSANEALDVILNIKNTNKEISSNIKKDKKLKWNDKRIFSIFGNTEFACELAYCASKFTSQKILLIDLDFLNSSCDIFLGIEKHINGVIDGENGIYSGMELAVRYAQRGMLNKNKFLNICKRRRKEENLYILTGSYDLSEYEYFHKEDIIKVIYNASKYFDIVYLALSPFIYDMCTVSGLLEADSTIIPFRGDTDSIRSINCQLEFLQNNQDMNLDKIGYVIYEYVKGSNLDTQTVDRLIGGKLLGEIPYSKKRIRYRNLSFPYARRMEKNTQKKYAMILKKTGIKMVNNKFFNMESETEGVLCR